MHVQPDEVSCGVCCLGQAYSLVVCDDTFETSKLSLNDVHAMRITLMWNLLCRCETVEKAIDAEVWPRVHAVNKRIHHIFAATRKSEASV
ncbi:hypothetical protein PHMEG_00022293 [Phytophthora megakarya]|uniref:Uncharacterized protein n=1 Tax=Phytophthora megakarya TaxID=4795 RepID=A0A225VJU4_9STRA|nr:hypothetical protein PHMEG_00022293 [Phytophthora megakarya]